MNKFLIASSIAALAFGSEANAADPRDAERVALICSVHGTCGDSAASSASFTSGPAPTSTDRYTVIEDLFDPESGEFVDGIVVFKADQERYWWLVQKNRTICRAVPSRVPKVVTADMLRIAASARYRSRYFSVSARYSSDPLRARAEQAQQEVRWAWEASKHHCDAFWKQEAKFVYTVPISEVKR